MTPVQDRLNSPDVRAKVDVTATQGDVMRTRRSETTSTPVAERTDPEPPPEDIRSLLVPAVPEGLDETTCLLLVESFAELARLAAAPTRDGRFLHEVVGVAQRSVPGAAHASFALGPPAEPSQVVATDADAAHLDGLQVVAGEGPAFDAHRDGRTVGCARLADDPRWPRLTSRSPVGADVAVLAVRVSADDEPWGVLTWYGDRLDATSARAAELVAHGVAGVLVGLRQKQQLRDLNDQLDAALVARATIDQAKGIVMAGRGCSAEDAFAHLAAVSQRRNVKLRDVARALVEGVGAAHPADGTRPVLRPRA